MKTNKTTGNRTTGWQTKWAVMGFEVIVLFIFWIILSWRFQPKYLVTGLFASGLVTYLTYEFIYNPRPAEKENSIGYLFKCALRMILYLPWLILAIIKANIQVASIIIKPQMPIDPVMLQFETKLSKKISLVTLANSITLTPGTITVELDDNKFIVHSLVRGCAGDLETGLMQNKVARIFDDNQENIPPNCSWERSLKGLEK